MYLFSVGCSIYVRKIAFREKDLCRQTKKSISYCGEMGRRFDDGVTFNFYKFEKAQNEKIFIHCDVLKIVFRA